MSHLAGNLVVGTWLQIREGQGLLNPDPLENCRIVDRPRCEVTSKDHLVQPFVGKGA